MAYSVPGSNYLAMLTMNPNIFNRVNTFTSEEKYACATQTYKTLYEDVSSITSLDRKGYMILYADNDDTYSFYTNYIQSSESYYYIPIGRLKGEVGAGTLSSSTVSTNPHHESALTNTARVEIRTIEAYIDKGLGDEVYTQWDVLLPGNAVYDANIPGDLPGKYNYNSAGNNYLTSYSTAALMGVSTIGTNGWQPCVYRSTDFTYDRYLITPYLLTLDATITSSMYLEANYNNTITVTSQRTNNDYIK